MKNKAWEFIIAVTAVTGVLLQFYLILVNRTESIPETIIRFFSYFTILSNSLVAISFTSLAFFPGSGLKRFFSKSTTATAVTAYILLVGLGYQFLLRHIWDPTGLQWITDELLHSVIPLFVFVHWLIKVPKDKFPWMTVVTWTIYPIVYFGFVLLRGAASGFYPYYFIDVSKIGYGAAIRQSLIMLMAFLTIACLLAFIKHSRK